MKTAPTFSKTVAALTLLILAIGWAACGDDTEGEAGFDALQLEGVTSPDPAEEGDLCVSFTSAVDVEVDDVSVYMAGSTMSQDQRVHSFGAQRLEAGGTNLCTTACLCVESADLRVVVEKGERSRQWTEGSVQGCCESQ